MKKRHEDEQPIQKNYFITLFMFMLVKRKENSKQTEVAKIVEQTIYFLL